MCVSVCVCVALFVVFIDQIYWYIDWSPYHYRLLSRNKSLGHHEPGGLQHVAFWSRTVLQRSSPGGFINLGLTKHKKTSKNTTKHQKTPKHAKKHQKKPNKSWNCGGNPVGLKNGWNHGETTKPPRSLKHLWARSSDQLFATKTYKNHTVRCFHLKSWNNFACFSSDEREGHTAHIISYNHI